MGVLWVGIFYGLVLFFFVKNEVDVYLMNENFGRVTVVVGGVGRIV